MKTSINALHHQTTDWLRDLQFYKDEIAVMQKRLEEVAAKNTAQETMAQVEHFQNKFIMLNEQADILKHDVNGANESILKAAKENPTHLTEKYIPEATTLLNRMNDYTKSVADTRFEMNTFLSKTL